MRIPASPGTEERNRASPVGELEHRGKQHRIDVGENALRHGRKTMLDIERRTVGDVYVLDISGKITLAEGTTDIRYAVGDILGRGGKKIVLNLTGVDSVDGSGVAELLRSYTEVAKAGEQLRFLNVTRKLWELLVITKLLFVFQVYDSERDAVASFA